MVERREPLAVKLVRRMDKFRLSGRETELCPLLAAGLTRAEIDGLASANTLWLRTVAICARSSPSMIGRR